MKRLLTIKHTCRICEGTLIYKMASLKKTPLADLFITNKDKKERYFPLDVFFCQTCGLVQLVDEVNSSLLFGNDYAFYTGASPSSLKHFKDYAKEVKEKYPKQSRGIVYEIASNDGTLLKEFYEASLLLGIDPAQNVAEEANRKGIPTAAEFWNLTFAKQLAPASVIMANNVVAHVEDLHNFISGVKEALSLYGVFIFEVQYLPHLLFRTEFDNIYHEHRSFFSLKPLNYLLNKHGLKIVDVEEIKPQGGSIRVFATHKVSQMKIQPSVNAMLKQEDKMKLNDSNTYMAFMGHVEYTKHELLQLLNQLKKEGKTIAGYGASAKSNTLLNYCGIDSKYLDYIVDKTPYKIGKYTPGTHLLVISPEQEKKKPDYYLMLVWNYLEGVLEREKNYRDNGGKFIIPIPSPYVI